MRRLTILLVLAFLIVATAQAGTRIYSYHDDFGNDPTIPDWLEDDIHGTHDLEMCTNHDGTKPIKGVRCGATECGCRVDSGTSSSPWGSGDWTTAPDIVHCD